MQLLIPYAPSRYQVVHVEVMHLSCAVVAGAVSPFLSLSQPQLPRLSTDYKQSKTNTTSSRNLISPLRQNRQGHSRDRLSLNASKSKQTPKNDLSLPNTTLADPAVRLTNHTAHHPLHRRRHRPHHPSRSQFQIA